jgi:hypothetical protein
MSKTRARVPRSIAFLFVLTLAGCVEQPQRPADPGEQFAFRVARTPYAAAICIGRNAKARPGAAAEERTLGESGMEVIVRASGAVLAVAKILRDGTFSSVNIAVTRQAGGDRSGFARALVAGC